MFQGRWDFVEIVHFDKYFGENTSKKGPTGENLSFSTWYS